jgi:hypothetical protein
MNRFTVIDDACAILRSKGVYRQVKLYRRGDDLSAGHGSGYIRLYANGGTALPDVKWEDMDVKTKACDFGRLQVLS